MRKTIYRILSIVFSAIMILSFIYLCSIIAASTIWIDTTFFCMALLFLLICGVFVLYLSQYAWNIRFKQKYLWMLVFFLYLFFLGYLLFFSKDFARDRIDLDSSHTYLFYLKQQWVYSVNLVPFSSIKDMLGIIDQGYFQYTVVNLVGNFIAFMPFAFFLKVLMNKLNWKRFFLIMSGIIISVEIIQFFTFTGSMDIDDYILNILGTMIAYLLLSIPLLQKIIRKMKA